MPDLEPFVSDFEPFASDLDMNSMAFVSDLHSHSFDWNFQPCSVVFVGKSKVALALILTEHHYSCSLIDQHFDQSFFDCMPTLEKSVEVPFVGLYSNVSEFQ